MKGGGCGILNSKEEREGRVGIEKPWSLDRSDE